MKGLIFKAFTTFFALFLTAFLSSPTLASNTDIYKTKMGCMTCHQGGSMQTDDDAPNDQDQA